MSTFPPTNKRAKVDFELMGCRILALPYYFSEFVELYEMCAATRAPAAKSDAGPSSYFDP